jgi:spore germination protein GerM
LGRGLAFVVLFAIAAGAGWWFFGNRPSGGVDHVTVYYTKLDGSTEVPWSVSLGPARDPKSVAFYAATQAIAGPPAGTEAVRFPTGMRVLGVAIDGSTVDVDLSKEVDGLAGGSFAETAAFKSLVWTLTGPTLPQIKAVTIRIEGARVPTIPGGHFELDQPLSRASW